MSLTLKLVVNILLLFSIVHSLSDANNSSGSEVFNKSEYLLKRTEFVNELYGLKEQILESVNDQEKMQTISQRIEYLWPQIENIFTRIITDSFDNQLDTQQVELRTFTAHLLFLTKARHCESPDETFYQPVNQCLPVGSTKSCPENMILNDGPGNEGYCDCISEAENIPPTYYVYSNQNSKCFALNSLGPCQDGEWFEIDDNNQPQCQPAPEGCPVDGHHVYWSNDPEKPKQCWQTGRREACQMMDKHYLERNSQLRIECIFRSFVTESVFNASPNSKPPCNPGSYRDQNLKCVPPFF